VGELTMVGKTVSVINLKGGVGKSTIAMMLSEFLVFDHKMRVLVIDMDSQANLTYAMVSTVGIQTQERNHRTMYDLFKEVVRGGLPNVLDFIAQPPLTVSNISRYTINDTSACMHMVVSTPEMAQLDDELVEALLDSKDKTRADHIRTSLKNILDKVKTEYDYIIIDCPPGLSIFSSAALIASDYFVSPIIPEPLSLQGINLIQNRITNLRNKFPTPKFAGTIMNIVKLYRKTHKIIATNLYTADATRYEPFAFWLPDSELLRKLGEFEADLIPGDRWGGGADTKFPSLNIKYSIPYLLTNPPEPVFPSTGIEGPTYKLFNRIQSLTNEFIQRTQP